MRVSKSFKIATKANRKLTTKQVADAKKAAAAAASKALHAQAALFSAQRKALETKLAIAQVHIAKLAAQEKAKAA